MSRRPPRSSLTDPLFPYSSLFLSAHFPIRGPVLMETLVVFRIGHFHILAQAYAQTVLFNTRHQDLWQSDQNGAGKFFVDNHLHRSQHTLFRSEEHTSELQSLMSISYAVFFWKKKTR